MNNNTQKIGVFTGSFNPFTIGHAEIVKRALSLFDKIIIGVGYNREKKSIVSAQERADVIAELYASNNSIEVKTYSNLTIEFAKEVGATHIIKGVRSIIDYDFEMKQADANLRFGGIDTIILFAQPEFSCISSSLVREIESFGNDISQFIPQKHTK